APAAAQGPLPSIADKTRGMEKKDGFLPVYWDAAAGKLWLEIPRMEQEMIYVVSLPAGVGSNDIGLDRGQLGGERIVRFQRTGPRVLLVQPNQAYRAVSDDPYERNAVETSFAQSVLWGFKVEAEEGGRVLVDATDFALRDAHGVVPALRRARQGDFRLDASRSALYLPNLKAFPRNTEIEATLTFTGDNPGGWVRDVTPTPEAVTVRERQSFVALPEPGYTPRRSDPRAGYFGIEYMDYATPIDRPITQRFIARHRLEKKDPRAAVSEPVEPIVYYLERGAPEPIRTALLEGARWWNQAFEAAGYRNAFRVELLPEGADPMDARYNVIQWVHRATRGWSYGASVSDPRTGEIIKGHVTLGSLRVRQDFLIAEGLLGPYENGNEDPAAARAMALARIRQLAAHEVGHTLGLSHNYVASTEGRASVMDYPHPLVKLGADGRIDLSDAYREGIGDWDKVAITWGYADFPEGTDERAALDRVLADSWARGLGFLTDQDARPAGSASPVTHMWDNGPDAAAELGRVMGVRRAALARFGERNIRAGAPLATLEEVLVPLYLHHRYQAEAASKVVGGVWYEFNLRGDGQPLPRPVSAGDQERALNALMQTLDVDELALPKSVLALVPPRPYTYDSNRELFRRWTGMTFDAVSPAAAAADVTLSMLLNPERAARLVEQHALDPSLPGLHEVVDRVEGTVFRQPAADPYRMELRRAVSRVFTERLMQLAAEAEMPQVRAVAARELMLLRNQLRATGTTRDEAELAHFALLDADITRFLERDYQPETRPQPPAPPTGAPIGWTEEEWD
ncbi:MAG TPA: zinc-dependent metalloprotease, partial [Longimicrobium sp.]|nr:zinc-dependent metalloprotease [Longimicrobium sp.]